MLFVFFYNPSVCANQEKKMNRKKKLMSVYKYTQS